MNPLTPFTTLPDALALLRTALALLLFAFLPGYLLLLSQKKARNFIEPLGSSPAETVLWSVVFSLLLLGFAALALVFSIGLSLIALLLLELIVLAGLGFLWRTRGGVIPFVEARR